MPELFFDHETKPIQRGRLAPPIVCTSWAVDDAPEQLALWCDTPAAEWLSDPSTVLVGANTTFDTTVEMAADPALIPLIVQAYVDGRVRDVLADTKLLDIAAGDYTLHDPSKSGKGWSLEVLAARDGIQLEKEDWRLRYEALDGIPIGYWPAGAQAYSLWDTRATRVRHRANEVAAARWGASQIVVLGRHAQLAAQADWALHLASCWGIHTDPPRVEDLVARVHAHLGEIRTTLTDSGLLRAAGTRDDKAAARRMIDVMHRTGRFCELSEAGERRYTTAIRAGVEPRTAYEQVVSTLTGVKLDKDAAILSGDELLIARADWISSNLLRGRAERMREGTRMPLQTRFDSIKETFRTSSTQPSLPLVGEQTQNFPRGKKEDAYGLREAFCPRGVMASIRGDTLMADTFIGADFSQAELHCLSELNHTLFGWSKMGDLLNAGVDLHWHFAAASRGISIEEVKLLGKTHRDRAKPANFGFPGGMGPDKFILYSRKGYNEKFERAEVVRLKQQWLNTFPEMRLYLKWVGEQVAAGGEAGWTHVHPITGFVRGGCEYTEGANHGFQHLCAYAAKVALVAVNVACFTPGSPLWGWRIFNFIHDEILLEGPSESASAAAKELARIMCECFNRFVPRYPTHADGFVTKVWSKKCETILGPNGDILEWKPKAN